MNISNITIQKYIVSIIILVVIIFLLVAVSLAQERGVIPREPYYSDSSEEPSGDSNPSDSAVAEPLSISDVLTSGIEPARLPIGITDKTHVESTEIKQATLADFCEVNLETDECTQEIKSIIFGNAVLNYRLSALSPEKQQFYEESGRPLESSPFGLTIINNEMYVSFVPSYTFYLKGSILDTLGVLGEQYYEELSDEEEAIGLSLEQIREKMESDNRRREELYDLPSNSVGYLQPQSNYEIGSRLVPDGLDRHNLIAYTKDTWNEMYISTLSVKKVVIDERIVPEIVRGGKVYPAMNIEIAEYVVESIIPYKKYRLIEVKNTVSDFVVNH